MLVVVLRLVVVSPASAHVVLSTTSILWINVEIATPRASSPRGLIDVSHQHPNYQLDGLDIDLTQAPHPKWLPSNIHLQSWDIFTDIPADFTSKYDLQGSYTSDFLSWSFLAMILCRYCITCSN